MNKFQCAYSESKCFCDLNFNPLKKEISNQERVSAGLARSQRRRGFFLLCFGYHINPLIDRLSLKVSTTLFLKYDH
jgi:hypothetical protein